MIMGKAPTLRKWWKYSTALSCLTACHEQTPRPSMACWSICKVMTRDWLMRSLEVSAKCVGCHSSDVCMLLFSCLNQQLNSQTTREQSGLCLDSRAIFLLQTTSINFSCESQLAFALKQKLSLMTVYLDLLYFPVPILCCFWSRGCEGGKVERCQRLCADRGPPRGKLPVCVWEVFSGL